MTFLGNLIWLLCGGLPAGLCWTVFGLLWSVTIIGIPIGKQCFKLAALSFCPFGKEVVNESAGMPCLITILWMLVTGIELALAHLMIGLLLCITVIGIPFGKQHFKLAGLALAPFGKRIVPKEH
ncbi:MAG: YccF domain-containing protein [Oscillospiraceae bacterium]|nr:YccF domain-containing protein [Oscillospiraceae bacterium]MCR5306514.1 YccF domain-containing protein [Oscillospiraceae bacterium]